MDDPEGQAETGVPSVPSGATQGYIETANSKVMNTVPLSPPIGEGEVHPPATSKRSRCASVSGLRWVGLLEAGRHPHLGQPSRRGPGGDLEVHIRCPMPRPE